MARSRTNRKENMYWQARNTASEYSERLRSRDGAAGEIGIDPRTLADYEYDLRLIPADVVARMADVYNAPELLSHYCAKDCPIGKALNRAAISLQPIERITTSLGSTGRALLLWRDTLEDIVSDGVVDRAEEAKVLQIVGHLRSLAITIDELALWAEKHLAK